MFECVACGEFSKVYALLQAYLLLYPDEQEQDVYGEDSDDYLRVYARATSEHCNRARAFFSEGMRT